jgi:hypothetical protein
MLRFASFSPCLVLAAKLTSGCCGLSDAADEPRLPSPRMIDLQQRYALGSYASLDLQGDPPFALESSNPEVVRIEGFGHETAALSFVGVGQATLRLQDETSTTEWVVEVVPHEAFAVVLSDSLPIPVGSLFERALLAGEQHILVIYLDAERRQLYGYGLAELGFSPGMVGCDAMPRSVEIRCLSVETPGLHVLEVRVGDQQLVLPFRTVSEREIVAVELLQPEEQELRAGTWVEVDVVGVTRDGTRVAGIHPRFEAGGESYWEYFAYQYDPDAPSQSLSAEGLGWRLLTEFRGLARAPHP